MKSRILIAGLIGLQLSLAPLVAQAVVYGPLDADEAAYRSANYMIEITHRDLTNTTTNVSQTISFQIPSNKFVRLQYVEVIDQADSGNTNYTGSTILIIGDGDLTNRYLTSMELNVDGTEVLFKPGRGDELAGTAVSYTNITALTTVAYTNLIGFTTTTNATTNLLATFTGIWQTQTVVSAFAAKGTQAVVSAGTSSVGWRLYPTNATVDLMFTPNAEESVSALSNLHLRAFFDVQPQ